MRRDRRRRADHAAVTHALDDARTRLLVGASPGTVRGLPPRATRALAVAAAVGAPGVAALDAAVAAHEDERARERALAVATAQARAVAGGLAALPVVAVAGLGALLDLPLWRFYTTATGAVVGAVGVGLAATGVVVALRLVRRAGGAPTGRPARLAALTAVPLAFVAGPVVAGLAAALVYLWRRSRRPPPRPVPGADEAADLVATALAGGYGATAALRAVADVLPEHADALRRAALALELGADVDLPPGLDRVGAALASSARWGAPAGPPLRRVAADLRADDLARALAAAERLPALLAFPTALCLLPACVLLVGAPLLAVGIRAAGT